MEITKQLAAAIKAAMSIAKSNGKHLPHFQALLIQGATITAANQEMTLRIKLATPLAPQKGDNLFKLDYATVKGALTIDRKALKVITGDDQKLIVNGISVCTDDTVRFVGEYAYLASRMDPKRALPAYEDAQLSPLFWTNLDRVRPAMAEQDIRKYLMAICMDFANKRILATDGHRLHMANGNTLPEVAPLSKDGDGKPITPTMILRREAVDIIQSLRPESVSTWLPVTSADHNDRRKHDGLFVFRGEGPGFTWELTVESVDALYPNVDRVIPLPYKTRRLVALDMWARRPNVESVPAQVVIPTYTEALEAFVKAFNAAGNSKREPSVIVDLATGRLRNEYSNPVCLDKPISIVKDDDDWIRPQSESHTQCGVNARYLADALKALGQNVSWDIDPLSVWRASDHGDLTVVVMPIRR
jgi:hypothetical protein